MVLLRAYCAISENAREQQHIITWQSYNDTRSENISMQFRIWSVVCVYITNNITQIRKKKKKKFVQLSNEYYDILYTYIEYRNINITPTILYTCYNIYNLYNIHTPIILIEYLRVYIICINVAIYFI